MQIVKLSAFLSLLSACTSKPSEPREPGTSIQLEYPVLLAGGSRNDIAVVDTELRLTTTTMASGYNYTEMNVVDSGGSLFAVKKATAIGGTPRWWTDMGTSQYRVHFELERRGRVDLRQAKEILTKVISAPQSSWNRSPEILRMSAAKVQSFTNFTELMDGCRRSWEWTQP